MKIRPIFAWFDFWVGVFWDRKARALYVFPVPMIGLKIETCPPVMDVNPTLRIWSFEKRAWWCEGANGYTTDPNEAGDYTAEEVMRYVSTSHSSVAVGRDFDPIYWIAGLR